MTDYDHPDVIEAISHREADFASAAVQVILEQHTSSFKWLIASLFAINGAGALVLLSGNLIDNLTNPAIVAPFIIGLLSAMLASRMNQSHALKAIGPLRKLELFWTKARVACEFDPEEFENLERELEKVRDSSWIVQGLGWLSAILFVVGVGITSVEVSRPAPDLSEYADTIPVPQPSAPIGSDGSE